MRDSLSRDAGIRAHATGIGIQTSIFSALNVCVVETMRHDWHPRHVALACSKSTQKDQGKAFEAPKGESEEGDLTWRHSLGWKNIEATYARISGTVG